MINITKIFQRALIALYALALPTLVQAAHHEASGAIATAKNEDGGRAVAAELVAVVTAIDLDTREVSLQGPGGETVTITAREEVVKLEDVSVGDRLRVTYLASLEGELREPGCWFTVGGERDILFDVEPQHRWQAAFGTAGIDPRQLATGGGTA